jgi:hypothetical protein
MTLPKDPVKAAEYKRKISEKMKVLMRGCGNPRYNAVPTEETRRKISEGNKGKRKGIPFTEEHRKKISAALSGRIRSEDHSKHISESLKGKRLSDETRAKMCIVNKGERNPNWNGGSSFEPYCVKFNKEFKERVRAFFGYRCAECGSPQSGIALPVHHVNFNKNTCCDNSYPLFVPLCPSCHSKTNHNRIFWEYWFTEMISRLYGGKCYFTKEEMVLFQK